MENTPYNAIIGSGAGTPNDPFISSMIPHSTVLDMNSYGWPTYTGGCSAECYTAFTSGNGYNEQDCGTTVPCSGGYVNQNNIFNPRLNSATGWQGYCENNCPRQQDHYSCLQYSNTYQSLQCTTLSGALVSGGVLNSQVLHTLNSATPPTYVWLTPDDSHNIHDTGVSAGDSWLQSFLVGSGSITSPAAGSLLSTSLFTTPSDKTLLVIWWDECTTSCSTAGPFNNNDKAEIFYGPNANVRQNNVYTGAQYNDFNTLLTIENNLGLSCLSQDCTSTDISSTIFVQTITYPSWNPNVNCGAGKVRITGITDNMTGTNSYNNSPYSPGTQPPSGYSLDSAKRWLTQGQTGGPNPPSGWVSPGPSCTVTNTRGQSVPNFVEIDGVRWAGKAYEDCATTYYSVNGGGSMSPGNWCDNTFNVYDPSVVTNYGTSCTSATDPTCYGRMHLEFDRDWMAAGYCGTSTTYCNNNTLFSTTTEQSTLIDVQGFVFWDTAHIGEAWHSFSGWELHALTAWRPHNVTNPPSFTLTFQGYDYDGAQEETLTLNGQQLIQLPAVDSPQNAGIYVNFNVTNVPLVPGTNSLLFTHANWDCGVTDSTKNVQVTNGVGTIFSDPTERALNCTTSITYTINV